MSKTNVGANLVFALEQKPVWNLWSRIYINRSPSGIGSITVFVRGRTQGSPLHSFSDIGSKNIQELLCPPINWISPYTPFHAPTLKNVFSFSYTISIKVDKVFYFDKNKKFIQYNSRFHTPTRERLLYCDV